MILVTHGLIGAAVGRLFPNAPAVSFIAGLTSHFILDAIPHWHYPLFSHIGNENDPINSDMVIGKKFLMDLVDIGIDFSSGIILPILFFQGWSGFSELSPSLIAGALGGMLPDLSHFIYMKLKKEPFRLIERFHAWIHSKTYLDKRHFIGIGSQILIGAAAVLLSRGIF